MMLELRETESSLEAGYDCILVPPAFPTLTPALLYEHAGSIADGLI